MIEIDLSWIDNEKLQNHMKKIIEDFFSLQKWLVLEAMGHKINPVVFCCPGDCRGIDCGRGSATESQKG